jgi:hypothetical protein
VFVVVFLHVAICECKCDTKFAYYGIPSGIRAIGAVQYRPVMEATLDPSVRVCLEIQRAYQDVHLSQHDLLVLRGRNDVIWLETAREVSFIIPSKATDEYC